MWFVWVTFIPQKLTYNYGDTVTCSASPRLFPGTSPISQKEPFRVYRPASAAIGKFVLFSRTICAQHIAAPGEQKPYGYRERLFGLGVLGRTVTIAAPSYPKMATASTEKQMLAPDAPLTIDLTAADKTFTYMAVTDKGSSSCLSDESRVTCNLVPLQLTYAQTYDIAIVRAYGEKQVAKLASVPVQTITPTVVAGMSIGPGAVVQDKPTKITIDTDKPIVGLGDVQLVKAGTETTIPVAATFADKQISIAITGELPRKTPFELRIASVKANDGSGFAGKSFMLPFATSGGPKVKGVNIGSRNVAQNGTISLTFDQVLAPGQPIDKNISITIDGKPIGASVSVAGDKVSLKPSAPLPLCAAFTVSVDGNVQSQFGIAGDSVWSLKSRAICYTTFSIGSSVRGRAITAYRFGTGSEMVVYMGAMHGSERNSKVLMDEWFNELNAHPERIPAGRSIVIIPSVNPDGVAAGTRFNARGVDINRNFPANDWKSVVTTPDSSQPTPAGGASPLSEPESQAVSSFIRQNAPRLVMSFHSKAAVVEANEASDSVGVANGYASRSRYRAVPKSQSAPVFQYDTTGAMEDWMRDKLGRAAIVVELATSGSSEFGRNKDALWYTVGL